MASSSNPRPQKRRRDKLRLLFDRQIGSFENRPSSIGKVGGFERAILKSQSAGDKLRPSYYQKDILGHFGCVNAVEFSPNGEDFLASGGDDKRVLIWKSSELFSKIEKPKAEVMKGRHESNIFCLAFTSDLQQILSSGNDHTVIVHNLVTGAASDVYILEKSVDSLSIHPDTDRIFLTACEDGRLQVWDRRLSTTNNDGLIVANQDSPFQSASFNPIDGRLIASANTRTGVQLWDVRKPLCALKRYNTGERATSSILQDPCHSSYRSASCMNVRWDSRGERLLALRQRMTPVLFHISDARPIAYFNHRGYYNSCTMKSCCFAGLDDEYVVTGSDNFNVYVWTAPTVDGWRYYETGEEKPIVVNEATHELKGHRSIVNQVRFSKSNHMLASSGVEKMVKLWSPWPMPGARGCGTCVRPLYTHREYLRLMQDGDGFDADQEEQEAGGEATDEDRKMLAFFDSLILREMETYTEDDPSVDDFGPQYPHMRLIHGEDNDPGGEVILYRIRSGRVSVPDSDSDSGQYNDVVVASETDSDSITSSESDTDSSSSDHSSDSELSDETDSSSSSSSSESSDSSNDYTNRRGSYPKMYTSDPESDRRQFFDDGLGKSRIYCLETVSGGANDRIDTDELDPAHGYTCFRPTYQRDVTSLVLLKRQTEKSHRQRRRLQRAMSDPGPRKIASINHPSRDGTLTKEEVQRRTNGTFTIRIPAPPQVQGLNTDLLVELMQRRANGNAIDMEDSSDSDEESAERRNERQSTFEDGAGTSSSRETFRKRPRTDGNDEAGTSSDQSPAKKRQYRRRMSSSSSSDDE